MKDMIDVRLAGRYRLETEVGAGGMTTVWQAIDEVLERRVAVKILHRHLLSNEVFCERFRREALSAGALTHHNIVSVYDTGQYDDAPYVVTEYLGGGSLEQALQREGPLPAVRVASMGADICEALDYAHRAGAVHRDLKPSNIVFSDAGPLLGQVKVADFGVAAAALGGDLTATGALLGTLSFLAPEVLEGGEPGPESDLFALGVILFKALTGRSPRAAGNDLTGVSRVRAQPARPRDFRPDVPRDLDAIVARAMAELPQDRFADAAEMGRLLRSAAHTRGVRVPETPAAPPVTAPDLPADDTASFVRSEGRWLVPVVLLVLLAVAIVLGVLQLSGHLPAFTGGSSTTPTNQPATNGLQAVSLSPGGIYKPNLQAGDTPDHTALMANPFTGKSPPWKTEAYFSATFGGLYKGIGIYGKLAQATDLRQVEVDSPTPGWQGTIEYSDDGTTWTSIGNSVTATGTQDFTVSNAGSHQYWMVWITSLPQVSGQSGSYQVQISAIKAYH
jgi:serine/threonine protein kinase